MHHEIANFPNQFFYEGKLNVAFVLEHLSENTKNSLQRQPAVLALNPIDEENKIQQLLTQKRFDFIVVEESPYLPKTNIQEANYVVQLVKKNFKLYKQNNKEFNAKKSIGIIEPFRNQIALIKHKLKLAKFPNLKNIKAYNAKRYQ